MVRQMTEKIFKWGEIHLRYLHGLAKFISPYGGPVILSYHGTPEWSFRLRGLSGQFRCIAPNLLGMGLSYKLADADYSCAAHSERLGQFINVLHLSGFNIVQEE